MLYWVLLDDEGRWTSSMIHENRKKSCFNVEFESYDLRILKLVRFFYGNVVNGFPGISGLA